METVKHLSSADATSRAEISLADLAGRLRLEVAVAGELLQLFVDTSSKDLKTMTDALESGESGIVASSAHSIKGAALNLGFEDLATIAQTVEKTAEAGALEGIAEPISELGRRLRAVAELLDRGRP
jgi:HPt (histidine-containing phosphotransfer) domain-containing protein